MQSMIDFFASRDWSTIIDGVIQWGAIAILSTLCIIFRKNIGDLARILRNQLRIAIKRARPNIRSNIFAFGVNSARRKKNLQPLNKKTRSKTKNWKKTSISCFFGRLLIALSQMTTSCAPCPGIQPTPISFSGLPLGRDSSVDLKPTSTETPFCTTSPPTEENASSARNSLKLSPDLINTQSSTGRRSGKTVFAR